MPTLPALSLGVLTAALLALPGHAGDELLTNPDFELGEPGSAPDGWTVTPNAAASGFVSALTDDDPHSGATCVRVAFEGDGSPSSVGNLMQVLDAASLRNREIKLTAALRAGGGGRAQMWVRCDRESGARGLFDNMGDRPVRSSDWTEVSIEGVIDEDAVSLNIGFLLIGTGAIHVDSVRLEVGDELEPLEASPPAPLEGRALDNLVAFTRVLGLVRHFHASDEAAGADWDALAIAGAQAVEDAGSPDELAARLREVFGPVAPSARFVPTGDAIEVSGRPDVDGLKVRQWSHLGFGQGVDEGSIYTSVRNTERVSDGEVPEGFARPEEPVVLELPGGVTCAVPLAVWADDGGTLPRGSLDDVPTLPASHRATGADRTTRLAAVALGWNVFQHFYPYFDVVETDWPAELERALAAAAVDATEAEFLVTLQHMVAALHDGHGNVYHASGTLGPSLPLAWDWIDGELVVTDVGPSAAAHVAPGDVVTRIDGRSTEELLRETEARISGATPQWKRSVALRRLLSGTDASPRELTLRDLDANDAERVVELTPGPPLDRFAGRPEPITELVDGLWYLDLDRVSDGDFERALPDLAEAEGIVFDLRGYPSNISPNTFFPHLIAEPAKSARWNVPIVTRPDLEGVTWADSAWNLQPEEPLLTPNRAFLTGGGAISYAESCMGIVEHYRLAEIVGGPTAGTNGNVNPFTLPGGYRVVWTGMRVLKHDGSPHHGVGILPTVPVTPTRAGVAAGRDEVLETAVDLLATRRG